MQIKQNIPLSSFTTFGVGGEARFFIEVGSIDELKEAIKFAKGGKLSIFVLGGGSNILISDDGFDGLVIKMSLRGLWVNDIASRLSTGLTVGAGEMWDDVVSFAVERGIGGIENLSFIPGTVGGAVYQNIGAYGAELKDVLASVRAYDIKTGNIIELSNKECKFGYRSSVFKNNKNLIVLEAELTLSKNTELNLLYPDLKRKFEGQNPNIAEVRQAVIETRLNKIPYPSNIMPHLLYNDGHHPKSKFIGNAGSFFKNPVVLNTKYKVLNIKYSYLKGRELGSDLVKLSAAQLIEKCGFKGKRVGNVGVSEKHALVLVNYGEGKAQDLMVLGKKIVESVKSEFGVKLEPEVEKIGVDNI